MLLVGSAHPAFLTAKESPSARHFSFHAPPSRSQIQASPRQLAIAGDTEFLDESGFGGWVDEKQILRCTQNDEKAGFLPSQE
jgi:hypothetical protein